MNLSELSQKLNKICRICLNECKDSTRESIFAKVGDKELESEQFLFIYDVISSISSQVIRKDAEYPSLVCHDCLTDAIVALKFKLKHQKSEKILEECLTLKKDLLKDCCSESEISTKKDKFDVNTNCEKTVDEAGVYSSALSVQNTAKICQKCNYVFKSVSAFNKHSCVIAKTKGRKLCPVCGKSLSHSYYKSHLRTHGATKRTYSCKCCEKTYSSSGALRIHSFKHSGEKPFLCSLCGKCFAQPTALKYHMRFHNNDRRYSCDYCEKTFYIQSHKVLHERTHTGVKPFVCNVCGKCFTRKVDLKSHSYRHTTDKPFSCRFCDKQFVRKTHLKLHEMIHSGSRPHVCEVCGKGFIQRSRMLYHARIQHTQSIEQTG